MNKLIFFIIIFILTAQQVASQSSLPPSKPSAIIHTEQGDLQGLSYPFGSAYLGIPFAAPPVGSLRFAAPQPPLSWSSSTPIFNATSFGPACPQACELPPLTCPLDGYSEDCLTLDVYTPASIHNNPTGNPFPVMLFYYGGDFVQGGAGVTLYSGLYLCNQSGIVLVVINYRLGALGFLHTKSIQGNFAIMDQTAALTWVKKNIANFGGDPNHVTIFGQSAGAMSVAAHLVSPPSYGLYQAAILESNPLGIAWSTEENALLMGQKFAEALGCAVGDDDCLRNAPIEDVLTAQNKAIRIPVDGPLQVFVPWLPWVDGTVIIDNPLTAFESGNYNQVPVMLGTVQSEGVLFVYSGFPRPIPRTEYEELMLGLFKQHGLRVLAQYPCLNASDCRPAMSTLATDYIFACPVRNATRNMIKYQPQAFLYHFDHLINADGNHTNIWGPMYAECQYQICHASELPFVFTSLELPPSPYTWGPGEFQFSQSMSAYWGNFGNTANPNTPKSIPTSWPVYTVAADTVLRMYYDSTTNFPLEKGYLKNQCDYWDSIGYSYGTFYQR